MIELSDISQLWLIAVATLAILALDMLLQRKNERLRRAMQEQVEQDERRKRIRKFKIGQESRRVLAGEANWKASRLNYPRLDLLENVSKVSPAMYAVLRKVRGVPTVGDLRAALGDPVVGRSTCRAVISETAHWMAEQPYFENQMLLITSDKLALQRLRQQPSSSPLDPGEKNSFSWVRAFAVYLHELANEAADMHRRSLAERLDSLPALDSPTRPRARL